MSLRRKNYLVLGCILALLAAGYAGVYLYARHKAQARVDYIIASSAESLEITYEGVRLHPLNFEFSLTGVTVSPAKRPEKVKVDQVTVHRVDLLHNPPRYMDLTVSGFDFNEAAVKAAGQVVFPKEEAQRVEGMFHLKYRYDQEAKEVTVEDLTIQAAGQGRLNLAGQVMNIDLELVKDRKQVLLFIVSIPAIAVKSLGLEYKDEGLAERLMTAEARERDLSLEEYQLLMTLELEVEMESTEDAELKKALGTIKSFINEPDQIALKACPDVPFPLGKLMNITYVTDLAEPLKLRVADAGGGLPDCGEKP